jgi:uncharacterized protein YjiS (DUF1127 family)
MSHTIPIGTHSICTCDRQALQTVAPAMLVRAASQAAHMLTTWLQRRRQRQALVKLDRRLLEDVGVSRGEALREAAKPFWRP